MLFYSITNVCQLIYIYHQCMPTISSGFRWRHRMFVTRLCVLALPALCDFPVNPWRNRWNGRLVSKTGEQRKACRSSC